MMASDLTYPVYPIFSFLGFVLVLVPLPWHLQALNAGTCLFMVWTALACLNQFVNSIVWHGNALNPAPVWCDISIRIITGSSIAIPAASLCINRRLYKIASSQLSVVSYEDKRRAITEDLAIGLGIPLINLVLEYIVTGHRFDIYEDLGCYPAIYNVWLAYFLYLAWPIAIGIVTAVYCVLSLRAFAKRQAQFSQYLTKNTTMTIHRYFRLMALTTTELICTVPFATYFVYVNIKSGVQPYLGWENLHYDWSYVGQIPSVLWRADPTAVTTLELQRWLAVVCAFVFFAYFGIADEARKHYLYVLRSITNFCRVPLPYFRFGRNFATSTISSFGPSTPQSLQFKHIDSILPVFVKRPETAVTKEFSEFSSTSTLNLDEKLQPTSPPVTLSPSSMRDSFYTEPESFAHAF